MGRWLSAARPWRSLASSQQRRRRWSRTCAGATWPASSCRSPKASWAASTSCTASPSSPSRSLLRERSRTASARKPATSSARTGAGDAGRARQAPRRGGPRSASLRRRLHSAACRRDDGDRIDRADRHFRRRPLLPALHFLARRSAPDGGGRLRHHRSVLRHFDQRRPDDRGRRAGRAGARRAEPRPGAPDRGFGQRPHGPGCGSRRRGPPVDLAVAARTTRRRVAFGGVFAMSGAVGPILAQNWGAGRFDRMRGVLRDGVLLTTGYIGVVWLALILAREPMTRLFHATGATADLHATGATADLIAFFCLVSGAIWFFNGLLFVANASFNN